MHYLGIALYAEGPTDYYFLRPLLQRLCEDICVRESPHSVEFSEVLALDHSSKTNSAPRQQRIVDAAKAARGVWRVLFVHTDGANNPAQARKQLVQPALALLQQEMAADGCGVAVIPIRETESWAIWDGDALRQVFGTTLSDQDLGLPATAHLVESAADPKVVLRNAFNATQPSGRRKKQGTSPLLNALGEQVSLSRLRQISGFCQFETELKLALLQLQILK
nr:DUF4276 family protein [Rhodoferax sp.]